MALDCGAVEAAVSDARAAAGALRRALAAQAPPLEPQPATAAVERLRLGFLIASARPAVLQAAAARVPRAMAGDDATAGRRG